MLQNLRTYAAILLACAISLTAHSAAAVQTARDATGQMVICTGTGPLTIFVDSEGKPTSPPHFCPDCVVHLLDFVDAPVTSARHLEAVCVTELNFEVATAVVEQKCGQASARGPPDRV